MGGCDRGRGQAGPCSGGGVTGGGAGRGPRSGGGCDCGRGRAGATEWRGV